MSLNRIVLTGRLTKDPEVKKMQNDNSVANFAIAVDRNFKNAKGERDTDFVNIVVYRKLAETCAKYLSKGKMVGVDGRLQIRTYDGQDGQKHWRTDVVAENIIFLSPKDGNGNGSGQQTNNAAQTGNDFTDSQILDDDIPF